MPFYVVKNQSTETYLSMHGDTWVAEVAHATIFTLRSTAKHAIRRAWQESCCVERIERLPDRIPRPGRPPNGIAADLVA